MIQNSNTPGESSHSKTDSHGGDLEPLQQELKRTLESSVPPQKLSAVKRIIQAYVHQIEEHYSGPLPHPRHFEHFERILPGSAERILAMAEKEQTHRHEWETRELRSSITTERIGLIGGIVVAIGLVGGAAACAFDGAVGVAVALVATSGVSMVPAIIKGREWLHSRKPEEPRTQSLQRKPPTKKRGR